MNPLVAIVGRPNVGKSTLFNRLVGKRLAIVEDRPGVTRDRKYADTEWRDRAFTVIDTGGFVPEEKDQLLSRVREQALFAVQECDVILWVVDARAGLTAADELVASELRRSGKPLVVAANKVDSTRMEEEGAGSDFFRLGMENLFLVSAEHGRGTEDLLNQVISHFPPQEEAPPAFEENPEDRPIRVAIVGRPNVGKSTLVNALLKEERMVAADLPGTTRDSVDSELTFQDREFVLTDTAGIRRKSTIAHTVEQFAVVGSLRAIERSDVAVVVLDAEEPGVDQDAKIISVAEEKGRALLVVVNKWDKVAGKTREKDFKEELKYTLRFVSFAPQIFTTASEGIKVEKVLELSRMLYDRWQFRAPTPALNRLLKHVTENHPLPFSHGKPLRLYYIAQVAAAPPTFTVTCNRPEGVPDRYKRYLINQLRETFDLKVPIRLLFRERPGKKERAKRLGQMIARKKGRR